MSPSRSRSRSWRGCSTCSGWPSPRRRRRGSPQPAADRAPLVRRRDHRRRRALLLAFPFLVLAAAGPTGAIKWIDNFAIQILIYVMLGWGLNIVVGLAGLLDLGYVAFYAIGAYAFALLAQHYDLGFWVCLPLAGILAAFWGVLLGFPVLRLRGDYLAIVTLAFGEIIRLVAINWVDLTRGYAGISGVPRATFFGLPFEDSDQGFAAFFGLEFATVHRTIFFFYVILGLAAMTNWVTLAPAPPARGPRLGGAARGRDGMPLARHQHHQHQAHRVRARRHVRRAGRLRSTSPRAARAS